MILFIDYFLLNFYIMNDTKASETNNIEADNLLLPDKKSNLINCDENKDENSPIINEDFSKENLIDSLENGQVNGSPKKETKVEKESEINETKFNQENSSYIEKVENINQDKSMSDCTKLVESDEESETGFFLILCKII